MTDRPISPPKHHDIASGFFTTSDGRVVEIRDVWASNLEEEMEIIRELVEKYNYVAMVLFNLPYIV
jgi:CCR4-NOT transcription complex subunit 7/8